MQKESLLFFSFSSESTFGEAKVQISEQNAKDFELFLFPHMGLEEVEEKEDGCVAHGNSFCITDDAVVAVSNGTIRVNLP